MPNRLISLLLILGAMAVVSQTDLVLGASAPPPTLVLGFLLLAAYCAGWFGELLKLPRITGYILAGLALGPFVADFFNQQAVTDLGFLTSLALAFIAFCAGGELKLSHLRDRLKSITFMLSGISLVVLVGVSLAVFALSSVIPFMQDYPLGVRLAIASIFGVISTARSPSSAIAIITETKAKGPFTDTVLAVTSGTLGLLRHISGAFNLDWKLGGGAGFYRWNYKIKGKTVRDPISQLFLKDKAKMSRLTGPLLREVIIFILQWITRAIYRNHLNPIILPSKPLM